VEPREADDPLDRLTLLERAQLLHDATLRRHGAMLERQEDSRLEQEGRLARHDDQMALLRGLLEAQHRLQAELREIADRLTQQQESHTERLAQHEAIMASLAQTLAAIKDMLERGNGRDA
jgi:hypothetical protein